VRAIGVDPVADTQQCFRTLVAAMSRPGTVHETPTSPADHAVLATLVDHEVSCYTTDETIRTALANEGRLTEASMTAADIVHATTPTDGAVETLRSGSLTEPSEGATIVYRVTELIPESANSSATTLSLSGPGIKDTRTLAVEGLPASEATSISRAQSEYPQGVDVIVATETALAALPRSVELEVQ
jgi:alpha-D-ribose 1-methylphosphonate 5-triphosphate synthase subunit PhnH